MSELQTEGSSISSKREFWTLIVILVIAFALRLSVYSGFVDGDDSAYISWSVQVAEQGEMSEGAHHWSRRIAVYYPVAALFALFGKSLVWAAAVPLFWSMCSIVLIYLTGKTVYEDARIALLGAALMAVFPLDVIMATQLFPAMGMAALTSAAFLAFYQAEKKDSKLLYAAAGLALGLAYMHRATALYMFLPLGIYLLYRRRWRWGYLSIGVGLAIAVTIESLAFWAALDDPFNRFKWITSYTTRPPADLTFSEPRPGGRYLAPFFTFSTEQEFGLFYFFITWATVTLLVKKDKASWPLILFFVTVALYSLWGTVSLRGYRNAAPWPRYLTMFSMPAILLLARWFMVCLGQTWRRGLLAVLVLSSLICVYLDSSRTHTSIGDNLLSYHGEIDGKKFVMEERAYLFHYFANGFEHPENVEVVAFLPKNAKEHDKRRAGDRAKVLTPSMPIHTDHTELADCLVAIADNRETPMPENWKKVGEVCRDHRWFAEPMREAGKLTKFLADKLSPHQGFIIYEVPPKSASPEPSEGEADSSANP